MRPPYANPRRLSAHDLDQLWRALKAKSSERLEAELSKLKAIEIMIRRSLGLSADPKERSPPRVALNPASPPNPVSPPSPRNRDAPVHISPNPPSPATRPTSKKPAEFPWDGDDSAPPNLSPGSPARPRPKGRDAKGRPALNGESRVLTDEEQERGCARCKGEFWHKRKYYVLKCGHVFHIDCMAALFSEGALSCPSCGAPLFVRPRV